MTSANNSASFRINSYDSRFDRFIMMKHLLEARLVKIKKNNDHPKISDIKTTHNLFVSASFKPYVETVSTYEKISGSLPNNMSGMSQVSFDLDSKNYHFISDMVLHATTTPLGISDSTKIVAGNYVAGVLSVPAPYTVDQLSNRCRFCAYPGIRMIKHVEFKSQNHRIDQYNTDDVVLNSKFMIPKNQQDAWDRMHGHSPVKTAEVVANGFTQVANFRDGLQTSKFYHSPQDM